MMIFVVLSVYVMYEFSINYSGTDIPNRKETVWCQQKLKRLNVRLSGGVWFEKNLSNDDSSFVPSDEEKAEGGGSNGNEERTYDDEEVGNDDE